MRLKTKTARGHRDMVSGIFPYLNQDFEALYFIFPGLSCERLPTFRAAREKSQVQDAPDFFSCTIYRRVRRPDEVAQ